MSAVFSLCSRGEGLQARGAVFFLALGLLARRAALDTE